MMRIMMTRMSRMMTSTISRIHHQGRPPSSPPPPLVLLVDRAAASVVVWNTRHQPSQVHFHSTLFTICWWMGKKSPRIFVKLLTGFQFFAKSTFGVINFSLNFRFRLNDLCCKRTIVANINNAVKNSKTCENQNPKWYSWSGKKLSFKSLCAKR